jgi:hypothetical protein
MHIQYDALSRLLHIQREENTRRILADMHEAILKVQTIEQRDAEFKGLEVNIQVPSIELQRFKKMAIAARNLVGRESLELFNKKLEPLGNGKMPSTFSLLQSDDGAQKGEKIGSRKKGLQKLLKDSPIVAKRLSKGKQFSLSRMITKKFENKPIRSKSMHATTRLCYLNLRRQKSVERYRKLAKESEKLKRSLLRFSGGIIFGDESYLWNKHSDKEALLVRRLPASNNRSQVRTPQIDD